MKKNCFLADCDKIEIQALLNGLKESGIIVDDYLTIVANEHGTVISNIWRYAVYFLFPINVLIKRRKYNFILCWQQFFAVSFCFYSRLFRVKKSNTVVAFNFTYKRKLGLVGKMYSKYMHYAVSSQYMDKIVVPGEEYGKICKEEFSLRNDQVIVVHFGLEDIWSEWKDCVVPKEAPPSKIYALAIGRSNRDFDFLAETWENINERLIIIADEWKPKKDLPSNVIHLTTVSGDAQFPYIAHCAMLIIPIDDGTICSGDTVLLKGMMFEKPVVITKPSTLAEMYLTNGENGLCVEKDSNLFADKVNSLFADSDYMIRLGKAARQAYLGKFTRRQMGKRIGGALK